MTDEELDELLRLHEAATPGPWEAAEWFGTIDGGWAAIGPHHQESDGEDDAPDSECHERAKRDAALIAAYRTAVPALVERVRELEADLGRAIKTADLEYDRADAAEERVAELEVEAAAGRRADVIAQREVNAAYDAVEARVRELEKIADQANGDAANWWASQQAADAERDRWKARAEGAEAEVERLMATVGSLREFAEGASVRHQQQHTTIDTLRAENARLREALWKYGWHLLREEHPPDGCPRTHVPQGDACTCGLAAALAGTEEP